MFITVQPKLLEWARDRAGLDRDALAKKLGTKPERVAEWEQTGRLRMSQAEKLAEKTHTPFGFLFLAEPPEDKLPIPDFRTVSDGGIRRPTPDLIETVEIMQRRQAWMRSFLIEEGQPALEFVRRANLQQHPDEVARDMRATLDLGGGWAMEEPTWTDALTHLRQRIEAAGVMIAINGVVGNNTRRKLRVSEFRGFALVDEYAPLLFVNGSDSKSAQMFTLAHELAHIWAGQEGVSNLPDLQAAPIEVEQFCNSVAAEFLVPATELHASWVTAESAEDPFQFLARRFKVSPLVAARRALDVALIKRDEFFSFYRHYLDQEREREAARAPGGNFWNTQHVRIGLRFGAAVARAAKEGRLLYREAYQLTGLSGPTFDRFVEHLGFIA